MNNSGNSKKHICIIGGGNIGTLLFSDLLLNENAKVSLLTSKPEIWSEKIKVYNNKGVIVSEIFSGNISNNPSEIIPYADIIISTLPSNVFPEYFKTIKNKIKQGAWLGFMPGSGGVEFICKELFEKDCVIFGFQRVHGIARIREYGSSVYDLGKKKELYLGVIPNKMTNDVCLTIQELIRIKCTPLANYLNVTLTPSNPILHTTRLYSIFKSYKEGIYWDKQLNFYEDWTNESSEILLKCDNELQLILKKLSQINLDGIKPLSIHYESNTPSELTNKIRSIDAFKGIRTPMVETEFGFIPDFNSRYFTEDFLFGLNIIKAFAEIILLDTPNIDMVLKWFEIATKQPVFNKTGDLIYNLPKKYGIKSINDIIEYYGK